MNATKIEILGLNGFTDYIALCDLLDAPIIVQRDKLPIWDGEIYLYDSEKQTKKNHRGVIKVQIKATTNYESDLIAKYPIETVELQDYLNVGGTVLFVVHVNRTQRKLFYKPLDAVSIKNLLESAEGHKTKTIELIPAPEDTFVFERDMFDLFNDIKAQMSFHDNFVSIYDWANQAPFVINAYGNPRNEFDVLRLFTAKARHLYVQQDCFGQKINIPIKEGPFDCNISIQINQCVYVNGVKYYNSIGVDMIKGKCIKRIGHCLEFEEDVITEDIKGKIPLKFRHLGPSETLNGFIEDLRFLLAVDLYKSFSIGNKLYLFDVTINHREKSEKQLERFENLKKVLDILHVSQDLNITKITPKENENIDALISAVLYGNSITIDESPNYLVKIKIGDLTLLFDVEKTDKGDFMISDYFQSPTPKRILLLDGSYIISSPFFPMRMSDYIEISNVNYDIIASSFENCLYCDPLVFFHAHSCLTVLLKAYDAMEIKNQKMFDSIKELANWIKTKDTEEKTQEFHQINLLQIIKRERPFNEEELSILYKMIEGPNDDFFKFACYVLLDELSSANRYFKKIDVPTQNNLKKHPIYYFVDSHYML